MIGVIIPPVAMAVFVVPSVTKESMGLVYKGCSAIPPRLAAVLALLFFFPGLATWLPTVLMKGS